MYINTILKGFKYFDDLETLGGAISETLDFQYKKKTFTTSTVDNFSLNYCNDIRVMLSDTQNYFFKLDSRCSGGKLCLKKQFSKMGP